MANSETNHYYKKIIKGDNVEAEYSSESDEITITVHRKTVGGHDLGTEYWHIRPQEIEPLYRMLKEVTTKPDEAA